MSLLAFSSGAIQLVPDGTLLIHLALIVIMVLVLNGTLLKPINRILQERERRTKGRLGEAQEILSSVDQRLQEYQRRLREARGSGYLLLDAERNVASREREELISAAKAEVVQFHESEKEKLKKDEAGARESLMRDAGARASEIGAKILGRPIRQR